MEADIDLAARHSLFDGSAEAAILGEPLDELLEISMLRATFAGLSGFGLGDGTHRRLVWSGLHMFA